MCDMSDPLRFVIPNDVEKVESLEFEDETFANEALKTFLDEAKEEEKRRLAFDEAEGQPILCPECGGVLLVLLDSKIKMFAMDEPYVVCRCGKFYKMEADI